MNWELDWLENRSRLMPNTEAIIDAEQKISWTFAELNNRKESVANWLYEKGVRKGDRVALLAPNDISYFDLLFACGVLGAIFVPINWRLSIEEIKFIIEDSSPKLIGYHSKFQNTILQLSSQSISFNIKEENHLKNTCAPFREEHLEEKDPLAIIYTGGTTGNPKGVVLSHQSILFNAINTVISWNLTNHDATLTYMPLFHTGGLNAVSIPVLLAGGSVVIANDFDPVRAIHYLNEYQCTLVLFVPTMYHMIIETDEFQENSFESMNVFLSGGAPCPLEIYDVFKRKGLMFKEGYGLTEAGPNNFYIDPREAQMKRGSVGKPMLLNSIKLINDDGEEAGINEAGEILIKGKHSFEYYWNNEEATNETIRDGWLHTGDLAKKDEDGYFYIVGRKKDMIITGGENVYPLEIEHWIASNPKVDEVAVIGVPDPKWGEIVSAFIVVKKGENVTVEEIKSYCSKKLGKYKIPKSIFFVDELPKTHVGKIDKKELKRIAMEKQAL